MCESEWLTQLLIWSFVGCALGMAVVSRKLNDHLLVVPTQPTGPFSILFRRKYHVKPSFLFDPEKHFDAGGQPWVKFFLRLLYAGSVLLVGLIVVMHACGKTIGAPVGG